MNQAYPKNMKNMENLIWTLNSYRTRAIITRSLYILYPLFEGQTRSFNGLFS